MNQPPEFRAGFVTIVGRPNAGKSTLINKLVKKKITITSSKPQTTRNRVIGICNDDSWQIAFVDTPGIHDPGSKRLNRVINRNAINSTQDVDALILIITADGWRRQDEFALRTVKQQRTPCILAINKIDKLPRKDALLPLIAQSSQQHDFHAIIPVSAKSGKGLSELIAELVKIMPESPKLFPASQITNQTERFMISELLREQIFRQLGDELPYAAAVTIDEIEAKDKITHINATIWVESPGHKPIVIGKEGQRLKKIGQQARLSMEKLLDTKVFLEVWVKIRRGWSDDITRLKELGLTDDV